MKKLISGIMAIAILASAVLCGTTTAFAADTGNSAVGDVEMWNHDFKNNLTGELMWAIDDIADTDTVAVKINLTSYCEDIYIYICLYVYCLRDRAIDHIEQIRRNRNN